MYKQIIQVYNTQLMTMDGFIDFHQQLVCIFVLESGFIEVEMFTTKRQMFLNLLSATTLAANSYQR